MQPIVNDYSNVVPIVSSNDACENLEEDALVINRNYLCREESLKEGSLSNDDANTFLANVSVSTASLPLSKKS